MAFNNIPPNGFPALPDVEDLEAVEKDVTTLKSSVLGLTQDVTDLNAQKANQITIAPFFNSETSYDVGDLVYYNGLTYRCTNAHEGEWDADDFAPTTIANELDTLKSGLMDIITEHVIETVAANTYTDNKTALLYLYTKYSGLSYTIKAKCYIKLENNYIYKNCDLSGGVFARSFLEVSGQNVNIMTDVMSLSNGLFSRSNITGSTCSVSDFSATSQNLKIELCY